MCPIKLADPLTLEASSDPEDWGVCSKDCNLKHYRTNQQIYDQVYSRIQATNANLVRFFKELISSSIMNKIPSILVPNESS